VDRGRAYLKSAIPASFLAFRGFYPLLTAPRYNASSAKLALFAEFVCAKFTANR